MTKKQRNILARLTNICGDLGGCLDYTAASYEKLMDRQLALGIVAKVIYGMFGDDPNNPNREDDIRNAEEGLRHLQKLKERVYRDKNGRLNPDEVELYNKQNGL